MTRPLKSELDERPSESDFVQSFLSIKSQVVIVMQFPLPSNPLPKRLVLLVPEWHPAMAIVSFELDQLFTLLVPELVMFRHGSEWQNSENDRCFHIMRFPFIVRRRSLLLLLTTLAPDNNRRAVS